MRRRAVVGVARVHAFAPDLARQTGLVPSALRRHALGDADAGVAVHAMDALARVLGEDSAEMLEVVDDAAAAAILNRLGEEGLPEMELCYTMEFLRKHYVDKVCFISRLLAKNKIVNCQ